MPIWAQCVHVVMTVGNDVKMRPNWHGPMYRVVSGVQSPAAMRLRYKVFAEELHWIPETPDRQDQDEYDAQCMPYAVYMDDAPIAYARVIHEEHQYMIEKDFLDVLPTPFNKKSSAEVSRLCVDPFVRHDGFPIVSMLLKSIHRDLKSLGVEYAYFVTIAPVVRVLRRIGVPVHVLVKTESKLSAVVNISEWIY